LSCAALPFGCVSVSLQSVFSHARADSEQLLGVHSDWFCSLSAQVHVAEIDSMYYGTWFASSESNCLLCG
jgi:hypothetical protein